MFKIRFIIMLFVSLSVLSAGCRPSDKNTQLLASATGADTANPKNSLTGIELKQVVFPIWWVIPGYQTGGSDIVIVFSKDQQIYFREKRNTALTAIGKWEYNQELKQFSISASASAPIEIITSESGGWDGLIHYGNQNLVPGTPDFSNNNIPGLWQATKDVQVFAGDRWVLVPRAMANLEKGGTIRLGTGDNESDCKFIISNRPSIVPETWSISPLGDKVEIVGGKGGGLRVEYQNTKLVLVAEYFEHVQGLNKIPPSTKTDLWTFGGLKAVFTPMQGPA